MFYQLRKDCYIRKIGNYGYIKSSGLFNDLVFDNSGQLFLSQLNREPQSIENLTKNIADLFFGISEKDIKEDVKDFFDMLVDDGYVVKGESREECSKNNIGFNYSDIKQITFEENYTPKNIRAKIDSQELLDEYFIKHPYLSNFQIEITSKCNERCVHCYIPHELKNTNIEDDLYFSVLEQLKEMNTLGVTLSGGEPMAHPHFKQYLKAAKDLDFYVHVLSNLVLLDDEMIQIMKEGNVCGIQTSLYSMIPAHHDAITTLPGSFERTKNNILKLIENNIPVQISCPVMKQNKLDYLDVAKWAHMHKIRAITDYSIMAKFDHAIDNLDNRLSPNETAEVIRQILLEDKEYQSLVMSNEFDEYILNHKINKEEPFCGVGINTACMVANGDVYPCPGWQDYKCGNLYKNKLKDIWLLSRKMNTLRNYKKKDIPKCLNCEDRAFCSPCLSRFANESKTGNPLEVAEHFCKVAHINKKVVMNWKKTKEGQLDGKARN